MTVIIAGVWFLGGLLAVSLVEDIGTYLGRYWRGMALELVWYFQNYLNLNKQIQYESNCSLTQNERRRA